MKMKKRAWGILLALALMTAKVLSVNAAVSPHSDPISYDVDEKYRLAITPWEHVDTIEDSTVRQIFYDAHAQVTSCPVLSDFLPVIVPYAEAVGVAPESCMVSNMLDVTYYRMLPNGTLKPSGDFDSVSIKYNGFNLDHFVCLLHYKNGSWYVVDNAVAETATNTLSFSVTGLSPFAVVVSRDAAAPKNGGGARSPQTGYDLLTESCLAVKEWLADHFQ